MGSRDTDELQVRSLVAADFAAARAVADEWFGHPVGLSLHRLFFDQLGPSGLWIGEADGTMVGVLLGLRSEAEPDLAYVHFHMVDPVWRGAGVGSRLYREFGRRMHARGCRRVRALAAPSRDGSVRFHEALGFGATGAPGYLGAGQDRLVFERALPIP